MNEKEYKFPEIILKSLFNKDLNKATARELEKFISKKMPKNDKENSLIKLTEEYVNELFSKDESKKYRRDIIKGNLTPIFDMINIVLKYENNTDALFILFNSIFEIYKELNAEVIVEYTNKINDILKNNDKIITKYINKLLDVVIILKIHFNSNVRECGKILDQILQNKVTQSLKDKSNQSFDSKKLINKLLEKVNTNNTIIKLFVVNWIKLIIDINQIQLINILQDILPWLFNLLNDNSEEVIYIVKQCLCSIQLILETNYENYYLDNKVIYEKNLTLIIEKCNSIVKSKEFVFERLNNYLKKYYKIMLKYVTSIEESKSQANLIKMKPFLNDSKITRKQSVKNHKKRDNSIKSSFNSLTPHQKTISFLSNLNPQDIENNEYNIKDSLKLIPFHLFINVLDVILNQNNEKYSTNTNEWLAKIIELVPKNTKEFDVKTFSNKIKNNINSQKLELIIHWYQILFDKYGDNMFPNGEGFIDNFDKLLPNDNEKLLEQMIYFFCDVANYNESYLNAIIDKIINQLLNDKKLRDLYWEKIMKLLSEKIDIVKIYQKFSEILLLINNVKFINEMVNKLNIFLISNNSGKELRSTLSKYGRDKDKYAKTFFDQLYNVWSYSPIGVLILTIFSEYYELSFNLILNFTGIKLENEFYKELGLMVQLLETSSFNPIRIKFLEPMKNLYLVRSIYGILMLLPQGNAFDALSKRMEGISTLYDYDQYKEDNCDNEIVNEDINYYIKIFNDTQKLIKN